MRNNLIGMLRMSFIYDLYLDIDTPKVAGPDTTDQNGSNERFFITMKASTEYIDTRPLTRTGKG